jgi:sugar (pentulose or hexulose) kinase
MIADALGVQTIISAGNEFGAKGAAMMAGIAGGVYAHFEEAKRACCFAEKTYLPDPKKTERYDELYEIYVEIRKAMTEPWQKRAAFLK